MPADDVRGYRTAMLALAGAWLFLASPWLTGAVTIPYDAKALFQAQIQFIANALHSGQSPFWSPNTYVGVPQIADPQSLIFSPAIILAYFEAVPSFRQLDIYVLFLLGIGALAILKLFEDRRWHPAGAVTAAIMFAFGGSAAWRIQHIAHIQSYVFFALTMWLLARALDRSSVAYGILAGGAAGLMLAEPNQVAMLGCYVLVGVIAAHWALAASPRRAVGASLRPLAAAALTGLIIVALPLTLTYLFLSDSNRPSVTFAEAARASLHPASLLTAVVADLYGAHDPKVEYWGPYSSTWDPRELTLSQNMSQVYFGALPALLILTIGSARGLLWARDIRAYVITAVALTIYALGAYTPAFGLLFDVLPGVRFFRRPVDATFLLGAMLAVIGGYLVHRWASATVPCVGRTRQRLEIALIAGAAAAALVIAHACGRLSVAWPPVTYALGWLLLARLVLMAPPRLQSTGSSGLVLLAAVFMATDLAANNGPNDSTGLPARNYEILQPNCRNETIQFLKRHLRRAPGTPWRDRIELAGLGFEWPNAALVHDFDHILGYNPLRLGVVSEAIGARDYITGPEQRQFVPLFPSYHSPMANMLGLRYIATAVPVEQMDAKLPPGALKLVKRTADAFIYENAEALPRVLFAREWSAANFDRIVETGDWPAFDPRHTVLLEGVPPVPAARDTVPPPAHGLSMAGLTSYENTQVVVEVDAATSGFVVLNDVWHPWWSAAVDGVAAPILKANVMFRAVPVPAGHHVVTFEFHPVSGAIAELRHRMRDEDSGSWRE